MRIVVLVVCERSNLFGEILSFVIDSFRRSVILNEGDLVVRSSGRIDRSSVDDSQSVARPREVKREQREELTW